jgi:hypothetical protein
VSGSLAVCAKEGEEVVGESSLWECSLGEEDDAEDELKVDETATLAESRALEKVEGDGEGG